MASLGQLPLASASVAYCPLPSVAVRDATAGTGTPRHSATNTRLVLPLAWMAARSAAHSSLHCLVVFCCATAGGDKATRPNDAAHRTAVKIFLIAHLRDCSAQRRPLWSKAPEQSNCRSRVPQVAAGPPAARICSLFVPYLVKNKKRTNLRQGKPRQETAPRNRAKKPRRKTAPRRSANKARARKRRRLRRRRRQCRDLSRAQCAVSVEDSSSTAGSVLTEVSVGLALSSSHSIGSGLLTSARASTSSMRETGKMSRFFLMLSLIS